ncbi:MAG: phosphoglycerate kinase [Rickettsiales bacterium]|jgi:phosphoglycerate kinase|nr:phosphoglycerate kinase [Rickettsiales bacterium]
MQIRTIDELTDIRGKYVLLRDDFNVQIVDGEIMDAFRIEQSLPTIRRLMEMGARIAIVSHLGRPDGQRAPKYSLAPVAQLLAELLEHPVVFVPDCLNKTILPTMADGSVVLLENVRFYAAEEENDTEFSRKLAGGFDIFVNDAFAVSHRAHASTVGVAKLLPSYAGQLLGHEITEITNLMMNPDRPLLGIVAGAKVSSKLTLLKSLINLCDKLIIGGAIANTFILAQGENIGNSLAEPELIGAALEILNYAAAKGCEIMLPIDKGVGKSFSPKATRTNKPFSEIQTDDVIMDAGPQSIANYEELIDTVKTVLWNGTVGMAEWQPTWSQGSFALARYIANRTKQGLLKSIIGGGDTVAALEATGTKNDMTYVSTGGGAFLEFIEGKKLPGIEAIAVGG